tara:strand:- start:1498 stop:2658 length:1161 start_codon:yes stop_codon:yes gene_type:complete
MNNTTTYTDPRGGVAALAVTLVIHIAVGAGIICGGWLETESMGFNPKPREALITVDMSDTIPTKPNSAVTPPEQKEEIKPEIEKPEAIQKPNIFVPVNPESTTPEPPKKNTPFYSNANTKAADKKPDITNQERPFIDGENDLFPGTLNNNNSSLNAIPKSTASQLAQPATAPQPLSRPELKPQEAVKIPHDRVPLNQAPPPQAKEHQAALLDPVQPNNVLSHPLHLKNEIANKSLVPILPEGPERPKAPTVAEQRRRLEAGILASRKMKQEGGTARVDSPTLDVQLTGYGEYDARFVQAVRLAWLRFRNKPGWLHPGKVVIDFNLHHDGTITKLAVAQNRAKNVQAYYCKEALERPAPFEKWTESMRHEIGADVRSCRFSFHYLLR